MLTELEDYKKAVKKLDLFLIIRDQYTLEHSSAEEEISRAEGKLVAAIEKLENDRDFWKAECEKACSAALGMSFQLNVQQDKQYASRAELGGLICEIEKRLANDHDIKHISLMAFGHPKVGMWNVVTRSHDINEPLEETDIRESLAVAITEALKDGN